MGHSDQALMFHRQGRLEMAEEEYLKALEEDFDNPNTLYLLGTVYIQRGKVGLAANLFKQVLLMHKKHFEAWNNLGNCYKAVNKDEDARACFFEALAIQNKTPKDYADIFNNLAAIHINAGSPQKAEEYLKKAIELMPDHPDANWNLSLAYLEQGRYGEGFDRYCWGFQTKNRPNRFFGKEIPYWDGSPDKNIVVWGEQGIGDELLFSSMILNLAKISKQVVFECHPRLVNIFKESFPDVNVYPTRKDAYIDWPMKHNELDARMAMGDLGKVFRRSLADFPQHNGYLRAKEDRVEHYRKKLAKLGDRPKVGISWTGGYVKTRKDYRSIPLLMWEPILKLDADFISLQYTPEAYITVSEVEEALDMRIYHWPSAVQNEDYHETAALVSALDLVITVNTAVHHLAGALGKEVWTLTPKAKAWRYYSPDGEHFPWYPSAVCLEQKELYDWSDVIEKVKGMLAGRI